MDLLSKHKRYTMKTITINGITYKIRYTYTRTDGSAWHVLDVDGGFGGEFGDEVPSKNK